MCYPLDVKHVSSILILAVNIILVNMGKRGPKSNTQRDALAHYLRLQGKTFQHIGSTLGISKERAWKICERVSQELLTGIRDRS